MEKITKWPLKQTTFMVPYPEGGGTDAILRGILPVIQKELGKSVLNLFV